MRAYFIGVINFNDFFLSDELVIIYLLCVYSRYIDFHVRYFVS
jgi:hypothetical protein